MRSVGNIQKITKAMKMVAASKMRSAQAATLESRGIAAPMLKLLGDLPDADAEKSVYVTVTTDRGLCGGINSSVVKYLRATLKAIGGAGGAVRGGRAGGPGSGDQDAGVDQDATCLRSGRWRSGGLGRGRVSLGERGAHLPSERGPGRGAEPLRAPPLPPQRARTTSWW